MSNVLKSADEVRKLAKMFKSLGDVVEVLDRVGSVEQAEQEAMARVEKLNAEAGKAKALIAACEQEAADVLAGAKVKADEALGEAITAAQGMQEQALSELKAAKADADLIVSAARDMLQKAEADAAAAVARRQDTEAEVVELEKRAEKARAYITKLQG
jgi:hypothetical protein